MEKVIVISAHPDDEIIGAGGTLLKHAAQGDQIEWVIVTSMYEDQGYPKERIARREEEIKKVAAECKIQKVYSLRYPTAMLNNTHFAELVGKISEIFKAYAPTYIYLMNRSDAHSDHRMVFQAVMTCTKSFRYPSVKRVLMYECISETEFAPALPENVFIPNYFVDISAYFDKKMEVLKIYDSELGQHPFPRSEVNIKALATYRGATAGVLYAEAFSLLLAKE
jgi:LmbE family N-acetylglucosaminyl deacetylase